MRGAKSLKPKLIHNVNVYEGSLHTNCWVLLTDESAKIGGGEAWMGLGVDADVIDGKGKTLVSSLIDTHCHGAAGFSANDGLAGMRKTLDFNQENGVARSLLSLVTASHSELLYLCDQATDLRSDQRFLGLHLEGPYLSPDHRGAHDPNKLALPTAAELTKLVETGVIRSMTVAPELFTQSQLGLLADSGIKLCLGHSDVDYEGAKKFFSRHPEAVMTHAFNAMNPIHHRSPGPVPAAIEAGASIELIVDGVHVHESVVKLVPSKQVILVTDAMSAAGMPDGKYQLGSLEVSVADSIARTDSGNLAGSTLTLAKAVQNYAAITGSQELALRAATLNPAQAYDVRLPELSLKHHVLLDLYS